MNEEVIRELARRINRAPLRMTQFPQSDLGLLYAFEAVIEGVRYVKFGFTQTSPHDRLRAIYTGCPVEPRIVGAGLVLGTGVERGVHRRLSEYHSSGEWYRNPPMDVFEEELTPPLRDRMPDLGFMAVITGLERHDLGNVVWVDEWHGEPGGDVVGVFMDEAVVKHEDQWVSLSRDDVTAIPGTVVEVDA